MPFCSGNLPAEENFMSNPQIVECISHADNIIDCMEENKGEQSNSGVPKEPLGGG